MTTTFLLENLKGRDHLKGLGVDCRILLKYITYIRELGFGGCGLDSSGSG
jgi:hypothetical protein